MRVLSTAQHIMNITSHGSLWTCEKRRHAAEKKCQIKGKQKAEPSEHYLCVWEGVVCVRTCMCIYVIHGFALKFSLKLCRL
jgi:hypothetical protein